MNGLSYVLWVIGVIVRVLWGIPVKTSLFFFIHVLPDLESTRNVDSLSPQMELRLIFSLYAAKPVGTIYRVIASSCVTEP